MSTRATKRPAEFTKPPHWRNDAPPMAGASEPDEALGPTRYGDWVKNGIAIDF